MSATSAALLNVGFDNAVAVERVVAVVSADPSPIKRLREAASRHQKLIDATNGRRTRTVIITDSDHVVLSSLQPATVAERLAALKARMPSSP
ncbi:MAG: DUF370 domain-containing protein [Candidatus Omnitrophica bacterium]|nr:DUF370 domain-containing protein [Candidatus Omnitrophota bacterium]